MLRDRANASDGKNVSAAKMYTINTSKIVNTTLSVRIVPMDSFVLLFANREPAMASWAMMLYNGQRTLQALL